MHENLCKRVHTHFVLHTRVDMNTHILHACHIYLIIDVYRRKYGGVGKDEKLTVKFIWPNRPNRYHMYLNTKGRFD